MDLSGIGKPLGRIDRSSPKGAAPRPAPDAAGAPDQIELSSEASEVIAEYDAVRELAAAAPPIRQERMSEVRERIASGDYDRPSVRKAVASKLAEANLGLLPRLA